MTPTKANKLIPETAKELGISEELVKDVVDFYYETLKKKVESLEHPTLLVHNFGIFKISRKKLKFKLEFLKKLLASKEPNDFKKLVKYNYNKEMQFKLEEALERCNNYYRPLYEKRNKNMEE
jgi:nucleoid DNA-binding protein